MQTIPVLIRTLMEAAVIIACILVRINSQDGGRSKGENKTPAITLSDSSLVDSKEDSTNQPSDAVTHGSSGSVPHHQTYSRIVDFDSRIRGKKRGQDEFSNLMRGAVTVFEYESTTSVMLSTLSSSLQSSSASKTDVPTMFPFNYSRMINLSLKNPKEKVSRQAAGSLKQDTRVGVLLPFTGIRPFVINKVAPAIEYAVDRVATKMGPWNFRSITVLYADSKCDIADAMNEAIQFHERLKTSAFFGPVCDYAIAPVARQARFWKTPIISAGGSAYNFYTHKSSTYATLTRVGPANLQGCSEFIELLIARHQWAKFKVLYDSAGYDDNLFGLSHLLVEYLHYHLIGVQSNIVMDFYKLDRGQSIDPGHVLRSEISTDYSGIRIFTNDSNNFQQLLQCAAWQYVSNVLQVLRCIATE